MAFRMQFLSDNAAAVHPRPQAYAPEELGCSVFNCRSPADMVNPSSPVAAKPSASQYALIIPSAGHLDGIDSHWQSDIRVTNAGFKSARYRLTFTPSGGTAQGVKQTEITIDAGATTALDDVISNWFGLGT